MAIFVPVGARGVESGIICGDDAIVFNISAIKKETICDPAKELDRPLSQPGISPQLVGVSRRIPILSITQRLSTA